MTKLPMAKHLGILLKERGLHMNLQVTSSSLQKGPQSPVSHRHYHSWGCRGHQGICSRTEGKGESDSRRAEHTHPPGGKGPQMGNKRTASGSCSSLVTTEAHLPNITIPPREVRAKRKMMTPPWWPPQHWKEVGARQYALWHYWQGHQYGT